MKVTANSELVRGILKKGTFVIPDYQRPFDWGEDEITEFFEDISDVFQGKNIYKDQKEYFIGHMVFQRPNEAERYYIIDGQQRFMTITILLCVIRDVFDQVHNDHELRDGIHDNFIFRKNEDNELFPVLKSDIPYIALQTYIQPSFKMRDKYEEKSKLLDNYIVRKLSPSKSSLKSPEKFFEQFIRKLKQNKENLGLNGEKILWAYNFFFDKLKGFDKQQLRDFRDIVLNLEIIFISVEDKVNAHSIFMTLNAKGKDLTFVDLIKNDIFSKYGDPRPTEKDTLESIWKEISFNFGHYGEDFFLTVWKSTYGVTMNREKLYKDYIQKTKQGLEVFDFVEKLRKDSILFRKINSPLESDWEKNEKSIYYHLLNLHDINNVIKADSFPLSHPFLMALLRAYVYSEGNSKISLNSILHTLDTLEKFLLINNAICAKGLSGFNKLFPSYAMRLADAHQTIEKELILAEFRKQITEKIPALSEFIKKFNSKVFYSKDSNKSNKGTDILSAKKLARYCLERLERQKQGSNYVLPSNLSIEHIYPFSKTDSEIDKVTVEKIGNLVLLDANLNSKIGNKEYEGENGKRSIILDECNLITTLEVVRDNQKWSKSSIESRTNMLIEEIYNSKIHRSQK